MAALLMLLACADPDCVGFDDIAITDPDGLAAPGEADRVRAAIDDFARWTGRDGVCVGEVRFMDSDGLEGAGGRYYGDHIGVRAGGSVESVTRHELCHAVDHVDGRLSLQHPDLFPPEATPVSDSYPTEDGRSGEGFAHECAYGPRSTALIDALEDTCGEDLGSARQHFLNEEVFPAWTDPGSAPAGVVDVRLERVDLEELTVVSGPVVAAEEVYVLTDVLARLDVGTGQVSATIDVPGEGVLIGGDVGPLLVGDAGAWLLVDGAWEARAFPGGARPTSGAVRDGVAWALVDDAWTRVDLATGEAEVVALPEGVGEWVTVHAGPDGLWGLGLDDAGERILVGFEPTGRTWETAAIPSGWYGATAIEGADGRLASAWTDALALLREYELTGLGWVDPADGRWWIADASCDETGLSMVNDLLRVGDDLVVLEWSNGWDERDAFWGRGSAITRVLRE